MDNGCKVLIGCETSGIVREAFNALGFDTWSCDVLPADTPTNRHIQDDVRNVIAMDNWDLVFIGHPPCTRLCNSGVRWLHKAPPGRTLDDMWSELDQGAELFSDLWNADVPCLAIENPVMHKYAKERIRNYQPFTQSVQPWEFAHDEQGAFGSRIYQLCRRQDLSTDQQLAPTYTTRRLVQIDGRSAQSFTQA